MIHVDGKQSSTVANRVMIHVDDKQSPTVANRVMIHVNGSLLQKPIEL